MAEIEFQHDRIELWVLGREFKQPETQQQLLEQYKSCRYKDAMQISLPLGEVWLFDYGVAVFWGVPEHDGLQLRMQLNQMVDEPVNDVKPEQYQFTLDSEATFRIHADRLTLNTHEVLARLAVSHAFAQSVKLNGLEEEAQRVILENRALSRTLAASGRIPLSRQQLARRRGLLFETRSDILLHFGLLDTPEFFWDYPELEANYLQVAKYLELVPRTELLNRKLEAIHELLEILASEQNHKHSSFLEWIIIILIAVEIVLFFMH